MYIYSMSCPSVHIYTFALNYNIYVNNLSKFSLVLQHEALVNISALVEFSSPDSNALYTYFSLEAILSGSMLFAI